MTTMKGVWEKDNGKKSLLKFSSGTETTVQVVVVCVLLDEVEVMTLNVLIALFEFQRLFSIPWNNLHVIPLFQLLSQLVWEDIFCHLSIVHFTWTLMFFVIMRFLKTGTIWLCQYSKWICFLKFLLKRGLFMSFRISKYPCAVVYLNLNIH